MSIQRPSLLAQLSPRRTAQLALAIAALLTVAALFIAAGPSMTPFFIGLVLAYLLSPSVNLLCAIMPRWTAILTVYVFGITVVVLLVVFLVPPLVGQVERLLNNLPTVTALQIWFRSVVDRYHDITPDALEPYIEQAIQASVPAIQSSVNTVARNVGTFLVSQISQLFSLLSFIIGLLIIPIWLFYLLNDQRKALAFVNRLLNFRIRPDVWHAWRVIDRSLSAYIRGQLTLGLIIGVAVGVGLFVLDLIPGIEIDYILVLAIWAGICELVPMIGALLGLIPGVILAFVIGGPGSGIAVLILYIVIQQVENNLLVPRVIGESVGVHPAILTVTLIAMGSVFGLIGVIAAAPATAIARDLYLYTYRRLGGASAHEAMQSIS
jgi:predicted PurR-regulated permease PerM